MERQATWVRRTATAALLAATTLGSTACGPPTVGGAATPRSAPSATAKDTAPAPPVVAQSAAQQPGTPAPTTQPPQAPHPAGPSRAGYLVTVTPAGRVRLVSPAGAATAVLTLPTNAAYWPAAASPTGRYIAFRPTDGDTLRIYDTVTHHWSTQSAPGVSQVLFTNPSGSAVVVTRDVSGGGPVIERRDFSGHVQLTIADGTERSEPGYLPTPDGTAYVQATGSGGLTLHENATGRVTRTLSTPVGRTCTARRWWDATTVAASCHQGDSLDYEVFLVSTDGSRATQLTRLGADGLGFDSAWSTGSGTVVRQISTCGPGRFGTLTASRTLVALTVPGIKGRPDLLTVIGSRLYILVEKDCEGGSPTLVTFDLSTKKLTTLGTVQSALVIDPLG